MSASNATQPRCIKCGRPSFSVKKDGDTCAICSLKKTVMRPGRVEIERDTAQHAAGSLSRPAAPVESVAPDAAHVGEESVKCPRCGERNPEEAKFCVACAAPIALLCRRCGTRLPSSAKYCFQCAHPVDETTPVGSDGQSRKLQLREARDAFEREFILAELRAQAWNVTRAAEELGIERSHLYRKMKEYGIAPDP